MEMKTLLLTATYLVGIGELLLAIFFWRTHSKNEIRKVMASLTLFTGLWVLVTAFNSYSISSHAEFIDKFTYTFGVLLVTALLDFSLVFPYPMLRIDRIHRIFMYIPAVIFSIMIFYGGDIVSHYYSGPTLQGLWVGGRLYWLYNLYLLCLFIAASIILIRKVKKTDGIHRHNLVIVIWSILLGGAPGMIFDVVVPLLTNEARFPLVGTISSVSWLALTSYIVIKK